MRAFGAFSTYRDMGARRSLAAAEALWRGESTVRAQRSGRFSRWSIDYHWTRRAEAWDAEVDRRKRAAQIQAAEQMGLHQAEQAAQSADVLFAPVQELLRRQAADPDFLSRLPILDLLTLVISGSRVLPAIHRAESLARLGPDETPAFDAQLPEKREKTSAWIEERLLQIAERRMEQSAPGRELEKSSKACWRLG